MRWLNNLYYAQILYCKYFIFLIYRPVKFKLRYEFVDYQQDGTPIYSEHECQRKFVSSELERRDMGKFRSVRNIFLFGRGGASDMK